MERNTIRTLEVGDVLYRKSRYQVDSKLTIDRVTKAVAFSGKLKFKRQFTYSVTLIGADRWSTWSYFIETPELKEQLERRKLSEEIQQFRGFNSLTIETLRQIVFLLNIEPNPERSVATEA